MDISSRTGSDGKAPADERERLSRDLIFKVALEIVDGEGADALSMRRLAQRLGCDPMALYRHAANKSALLDGLTELVLGQLTVDPSDAPWPNRLRDIARQFRELALTHPHVVPLLVTRPLATPLALRPPGTLRPLENILELLVKAGFSAPDALYAYRALFGFLHGHVLNELQENADNPDESDDLLRLGLYRLPVREFPRIRSLASELASYDGAAEFEDGLDGLLAGIESRCFPTAS